MMNSQALKARIKRVAKERKVTFQYVWEVICIERFLSRISSSKFVDKFVLKGGILLSKYTEINRHTKDIDFMLSKLNLDKKILHNILKDICVIDRGDGFTFSVIKIEMLEHLHMNYPGYTLKIDSRFENLNGVVSIDIGVGDSVKPTKQKLSLISVGNIPIFEEFVELISYPPEYIYAEKLETTVRRADANSRMKDFHDLYSIISSKILLQPIEVKHAVESVFSNRNTRVDYGSLSAHLRDGMAQLETQWKNYKQKSLLFDTEVPVLSEVLKIIDKFNLECGL